MIPLERTWIHLSLRVGRRGHVATLRMHRARLSSIVGYTKPRCIGGSDWVPATYAPSSTAGFCQSAGRFGVTYRAHPTGTNGHPAVWPDTACGPSQPHRLFLPAQMT